MVTFTVMKPKVSGKKVRGYEIVASRLTRSEAMVEVHRHEATYATSDKFPCKLKPEIPCALTAN